VSKTKRKIPRSEFGRKATIVMRDKRRRREKDKGGKYNGTSYEEEDR
jgi:hypothetical protein